MNLDAIVNVHALLRGLAVQLAAVQRVPVPIFCFFFFIQTRSVADSRLGNGLDNEVLPDWCGLVQVY